MKFKFKNKKGFAAIQGLVLTVVVVGVTLVVGLLILGKLKTALGLDSTTSAEYNATGDLITQLAGIPTWIGILILVAIFGIIIAYLMGYLGGNKMD